VRALGVCWPISRKLIHFSAGERWFRWFHQSLGKRHIAPQRTAGSWLHLALDDALSWTDEQSDTAAAPESTTNYAESLETISQVLGIKGARSFEELHQAWRHFMWLKPPRQAGGGTA